MEATQIPEGCMQDAEGRFVPKTMVKEIDQVRDALVLEIATMVKGVHEIMRQTKDRIMGDVEAFIDLSLEKYQVKLGGKKGNVTLVSFDGRYKVQRQISEHLVFDERLQAAKALVDECITEWTEGSRDELKVLILGAFQVDKEGRLNTGRILGLRKLNIQDERWQRAMDAISDSLRVAGSKAYFRVYERAEDGSYNPISLDMAAI